MSALGAWHLKMDGKIVVVSNSVDGAVMTAISVASSFFSPIQFSNHPSRQSHLHLSFKDLAIYLPSHTLHSISASLFYHLDLNGIMIANVNINPTTTHTKISSVSSLSHFSLCAGARRILTIPNAGGSSVLSEVLSAELLHRLFGATVIKTEMEIVYNRRGSPITDYACQLTMGKVLTVGVSVTRAFAFKHTLDKKEVHRLLVKKLKGINASSKTVSNCSFARQILHVWTQNGHDAAIVKRVWSKLPAVLRTNTIVLVTTINCPLLFFEKQKDQYIETNHKRKKLH